MSISIVETRLLHIKAIRLVIFGMSIAQASREIRRSRTAVERILQRVKELMLYSEDRDEDNDWKSMHDSQLTIENFRKQPALWFPRIQDEYLRRYPMNVRCRKEVMEPKLIDRKKLNEYWRRKDADREAHHARGHDAGARNRRAEVLSRSGGM